MVVLFVDSRSSTSIPPPSFWSLLCGQCGTQPSQYVTKDSTLKVACNASFSVSDRGYSCYTSFEDVFSFRLIFQLFTLILLTSCCQFSFHFFELEAVFGTFQMTHFPWILKTGNEKEPKEKDRTVTLQCYKDVVKTVMWILYEMVTNLTRIMTNNPLLRHLFLHLLTISSTFKSFKFIFQFWV